MGRRPGKSGLGYQPVKVAHFGAAVETGSGAVSAVQLAAYARQNSVDRPVGVVNDYVASALGAAIGAPVPPGTLVPLGGDEWGYISLGFGESGVRPPPADLEQLCRDRPWEASGILALDQWTLNSDRHDENVAFLENLGVAAFDHDCAVFGPRPKDGISLTENLERGLRKAVRGHEMAPHLLTAEHLAAWIRRVKSISPEEIRRIAYTCFDAKLIDRQTRDSLIDFLLHRQRHLEEYFEMARDDFTSVTAWTLGQGGAV